MKVALFFLVSFLAFGVSAQVVTSNEISIKSLQIGVSSSNGGQYGALVTIAESPFLCQGTKSGSVVYSSKVFFPASAITFPQISAILVTAITLDKKVRIVTDGCNLSSVANGVAVKM